MKKGFIYIITTMILIMLITGIVVLNSTHSRTIEKAPFFVKNYVTEFLYFSSKDALSLEEINSFNSGFKDHINSYNYSTNICNIIETNEGVFLSNYTDNDCEIMIDEDNNLVVESNSTKKIDMFINQTNIYLCSCKYIDGQNSYYIDVYNKNIKIIEKN